MTTPMPKDNEVDEKVKPLVWIVTNGGETCEPWLEYEQSEVDALPAVCIAEPLYSAATVAELRAEVEKLRAERQASLGVGDGSGQLIVHGKYDSIKECQRKLLAGEAAERRVRELEAALLPLADATFDEFCSSKTERVEPDDAKVSYPEETCNITFGMIRNARKALTGADPT